MRFWTLATMLFLLPQTSLALADVTSQIEGDDYCIEAVSQWELSSNEARQSADSQIECAIAGVLVDNPTLPLEQSLRLQVAQVLSDPLSKVRIETEKRQRAYGEQFRTKSEANIPAIIIQRNRKEWLCQMEQQNSIRISVLLLSALAIILTCLSIVALDRATLGDRRLPLAAAHLMFVALLGVTAFLMLS